jgi:A/G-specific adenine glycosylase
MLQQTRVAVVRPYYRRFVAAWPALDRLAAARDEDVYAAWSGLGYYARCRNLLAAARAALARHGGLPASLAALRALPGFGPYTAGAVASIAFDLPAAAVDGNVARVLARLFAVRGEPVKVRARIWEIARELVGESADRVRPFTVSAADGRTRSAESAGGAGSFTSGRPGDWNQALIDLGATLCGRTPSCGRCPVEGLCAARASGLEAEIPAKRRRPPARQLVLACAVVERRGRVLLCRRPAGGLFAGLLGFPAAEVRAGASPRQALAGALRAAGLPARVGTPLGAVDRKLTHRDLRLTAFSVRLVGPDQRSGAGRAWVRWAELEQAGLPTAMKALLPLAFSGRVV